ncbi:hypothetical protein RAS1_02300 [Phycisphaerae bacterium RAS1]|nr:hypothetical protein RAS1_02300 [Phycisphaerae bacterium RAS1]
MKRIVAATTTLLTLACVAGCPDEVNVDLGRLAGVRLADITDGTSNTILVSEADAGGRDDGDDGVVSGRDPIGGEPPPADGSDPSQPATNANGGTPLGGGGSGADAGDAGTDDAPSAERFTELLGDKFFSLDSNLGNSDRDAFLSARTELHLCKFGRFVFDRQSFFSSDVGGGDSRERSAGTWNVEIQPDGLAVLVLSEEPSLATPQPGTRRFAVETDAAGKLFIAGDPVLISEDRVDVCADLARLRRDAEEIAADPIVLAEKRYDVRFESAPDARRPFLVDETLILCASGEYARRQFEDRPPFNPSEGQQTGRWTVALDALVGAVIQLEPLEGSTFSSNVFGVSRDGPTGIVLENTPAQVTSQPCN